MFNKIVILMVLLFWSAPIFAQNVILEFPLRPVVNSNRVIGLGGAFVGIAEGADGHTYNPASFASRYSYSRDQLWDWDWALYWLNLPKDAHGDFNQLQSDKNSSFHLGIGIDIKYSFFGAGLHAYNSNYQFSTEDDYTISQTVGIWGFAITIPKLQLTLGGALNSGSGNVLLNNESLVNFEGSGGSFGALWFPPSLPFRIGINLRLAQRDDEIPFKDGTFLSEEPASVIQPTELTLGGSWMLWEKKYNPKHTFGDIEAEGEVKVVKRRYVLIAADLVTTFKSPQDTLSITTLVDSVQRASGENVNLALRLGVESEVLANRLTFRTGYYQQPSRLVSTPTYHHFTAGADLRISFGLDWKLNTVLDVSKDYLNFGLGVGLWH